jgi:hypothetical protein
MSISIECSTHCQYYSISNLIDEIRKSPTLGLEQVYALVSSLPGFKEEGRTEHEVKGNFVQVCWTSLLADRLSQNVLVRWERVYHLHQFLMPRNRDVQQFSVHFRDEFSIGLSIRVFALDEVDAIQSVAREGYGHAGGKRLFPNRIEKAERVSA